MRSRNYRRRPGALVREAALPACSASTASSTCPGRSLPKNIFLPKKKVGTPKTPRSPAAAVSSASLRDRLVRHQDADEGALDRPTFARRRLIATETAPTPIL